MTREEQLAWEVRAGRPAAYAAFASALLGMAGLVAANVSLRGQSNDAVEGIVLAHKHLNAIVVAGIVAAISFLLLIPPLLFLYRTTRYRRPELPPATRYLAIVGPVLYAIGLVGQAAVTKDAVNIVFQKLPLSPKVASDLVDHQFTTGPVATWKLVLLGMGVLVGGAMILISLNARRAGLLSGFMGITGIIVGVLVILPLFGQPPIIYFFWIAGLGLLFVNRWPGAGRGPAWESGEAIPWPTAAEVRAQQDAARGGGAGDGKARRPRPGRQPEPEPDVETGDADDVYEDEPEVAGTPHPRSKKRKRKRRR